VRATTAAPTFFPPIKFGRPPQNWIDGGLRHNNPVRVLFDEAKMLWPTHGLRKLKCIVSIGTGDPPIRAVGGRGLELVAALRRIALDTEETHRNFRNEVEHLPSAERFDYMRFNAKGTADIGLEEWKHFERLAGATNDYLNNQRTEIDNCAMMILNQRSELGSSVV